MKKSYRHLERVDEYVGITQDFLNGKTFEQWRDDLK